jgi:hypothetical protein
MDGRSNPVGVAREKEVALMMRRIISLVVVALVIAAMMLVMAMPAFAQGNSEAAHFCRDIAGTPPEFPPGACTSFFAPPGGDL